MLFIQSVPFHYPTLKMYIYSSSEVVQTVIMFSSKKFINNKNKTRFHPSSTEMWLTGNPYFSNVINIYYKLV